MTGFNNVLLIEDNLDDARLVGTYLDDHFGKGCTVHLAATLAATLAAGLAALGEAEPDVVLLDLGLPDSQGLAGYLAVHRAAPGTPVVILTGDDDDELALDALRTGAEDCLAKQHTTSATLLRAMRLAVQRRQLGEGLHRREAQCRAIEVDVERCVGERTASLESANAELRGLNRSLAHDLRGPLAGIIGMTQLVRRDAREVLPSTAWRRLQLIEQSALDMNGLIERLLSLAEQRQQAPPRERLDLTALAQAIAERLTAAEPRRPVRWRIAPGIAAQGDRALVASLLQNLLENAWKYSRTTAAAEIEFGCEIPAESPGESQDEGQGAEATVFFVRDNGVGFAMEQASQLFEDFERLPSSAGHEGSGLGLAGARRTVERHGGAIWADSSPGAGATFRFTLGRGSRGGESR